MFQISSIFLIAMTRLLTIEHADDIKKPSRLESRDDEVQRNSASPLSATSSSAERADFSVAGLSEKSFNDSGSLDQIMDLSTLSGTPSCFMTLQHCEEAIKKYPQAASLILQSDDPNRGTVIAPPSFYDHFISAIPRGITGNVNIPSEALSEKYRHLTQEVFSLLQREYGEAIATASFASIPHRITIAHPLSSKDLHEVLTTAKTLQDQEKNFSAIESAPEIEALKKEIEDAEKKAEQATIAREKRVLLLDQKNLTAQQHPSIRKTHLLTSALKLEKLAEMERTAYEQLIFLKDRLAVARRNALQEYTPPDSLSETSSEETSLLFEKRRPDYGSMK